MTETPTQFLEWLASLDDDDPNSPGRIDRQTVRLQDITDRARAALATASPDPLKAFVRDLATHGIRFDLNPTIDSRDPLATDRYVGRIDMAIRKRAIQALGLAAEADVGNDGLTDAERAECAERWRNGQGALPSLETSERAFVSLGRCGDCGHPWEEHLRDLGIDGYAPQGCTWPSCRCTEPGAAER